MPSASDQGYDVFISYSHQDTVWVHEQLLPRLEGAGLRVCIDERDFAIGVSSLINMERAVDTSRHTLLVLTPDWVASEWTEFESLLAGTSDPVGRRRKIIPLMLKQCEPPSRIAMLTWADFRESQQHERQFNRLINQLRTISNTSQSEPRDSAKSSIQTGGGAGIEGSVITEGGDIVGRDKTV